MGDERRRQGASRHGQRFGPYSFVVNTDKIACTTAEEQGWDLFNDPKLTGRYGVQESDDWNVFDIFLVAGINPFKEHSDDEMNTFKDTAKPQAS
jgi:spermidine/putrescine transport system substrate-binding protein